MRERDKQAGRRLLRPLIGLLARVGVSPNAVTLAAVPLSILGLAVRDRAVLLGGGGDGRCRGV